MRTYILRRLAFMVVVVFLVTIVGYFIIEQQRLYRHCTCSRPLDSGVEAMLGGCIEIVAGVKKIQARFGGLSRVGQRGRHAIVERGIGDHVHDRRAGRYDALLDTHVQAGVAESDQGPHPAPDRAIVKLQVA